MKMTEAKMAFTERGGMERSEPRVVEKTAKEKRDIDERLSAYVNKPSSGKNTPQLL